MADKPPADLPGLQEHLKNIAQDPNARLDQRLLDGFQAQLTDINLDPIIPSLLPQLLALLPSLREDPQPLVSLIIRVIKPLSFTSALSYVDGTGSLVEALRSPAIPVNLLAIEFLSKAASSASDAAIVAGMKDVVHELVTVFLTHETAAAVAAQRAFESLLLVDIQDAALDGSISSYEDMVPEYQVVHRGQGLMWRRLFEDKDIYELFYSLTSVDVGSSGIAKPDKKQRTVSQTRLMGLLPYVARLDFRTASQSHFSDVEAQYGLRDHEGLLHYACSRMVDTMDDVLVHMTLIDFYTDLLDVRLSQELAMSSKNATLPCSPNSSATLDFLISQKIHDRASKIYLFPDDPSIDPLDKSFLTSRSANYLATYATIYPLHMLQAHSVDGDTLLVQQVLTRINRSFDSPAVQRGQEAPSHDLHVLSSLPRSALLPQPSSGPVSRDAWRESPIPRIPVQATHEDFLKTLSVLFHGPERESKIITYPPSVSETHDEGRTRYIQQEAAAARALYLLYFNEHPLLYTHLTEHANLVALKEKALAAISLMSAILTANWEALPSEATQVNSPFSLLSEDQLRSCLGLWHQANIAENGLQAVLCVPARNTTAKYLLSPPRTFSNLVGGRGDVESAAYKIAVAKFELLLRTRDVLREHPDDAADLRGAIDETISRGPWGNESNVGGRIGTMEM